MRITRTVVALVVTSLAAVGALGSVSAPAVADTPAATSISIRALHPAIKPGAAASAST